MTSLSQNWIVSKIFCVCSDGFEWHLALILKSKCMERDRERIVINLLLISLNPFPFFYQKLRVSPYFSQIFRTYINPAIIIIWVLWARTCIGTHKKVTCRFFTALGGCNLWSKHTSPSQNFVSKIFLVCLMGDGDTNIWYSVGYWSILRWELLSTSHVDNITCVTL